MYKVLLVDDEALIREAISENINWNEKGYVLMGACPDGRIAIEAIKKEQPDLLITDIYMPYVDGIELSKFVYQNYPKTKIVILSGYNEFEYAKQAVKYQVFEYLLKPVTAAELVDILDKVKQKLDEERRAAEGIKKIRSMYMGSLPALRSRFLNNLISGNYIADNVEQRMEQLEIALEGRYYNTAMVAVDDMTVFMNRHQEYNNGLAYFALSNICQEIMEKNDAGIAFQCIDEQTVLIFKGNDIKVLVKRTEEICIEIQLAIKRYLDMETTIGVGRVVSSIQRLSHSYDGVKTALEYKFLLGSGQILQVQDFDSRTDKDIAIDIQYWANQVILGIKTDNREEIQKVIEGFTKELKTAFILKNRSIVYIQTLVLAIMDCLDSISINDSEILEMEKGLLNRIGQREHLGQILQELVEFCCQIASAMSEKRDSIIKRQAVMALDYMEKNYNKPEITLNTVCDHLSISVSYFSAIFKSYCGETFIEALTRIRMEKAKNLLENTSLKANQVAREVGYNDPHYFSISFKKTTGKTPTEYSKQYGLKGQAQNR